MKLVKRFFALEFLIVLISTPALAETRYLFTPFENAVKIPHPLYGEAPEVEKDEYFATQEKGGFSVSMRITGALKDDNRRGSGITLLIKNLDSEVTRTIKPTLDLIDGTGLVLQVADLPKLFAAAKAAQNAPAQGGSFFVAGNQKFVNGAVGGYAIGSILSAMLKSSRNERDAKAIRLVETHWLKDEYRIPPSAHVDAFVIFNELPKLPLTARVTIGEDIFVFPSVLSNEDAEENFKKSRAN